MRLSIRELRKLVSEEVDRLVRNSAGFVGGGMNVSRAGTPVDPVPELGDETSTSSDLEDNSGKEQKKSQIGLRALNRER